MRTIMAIPTKGIINIAIGLLDSNPQAITTRVRGLVPHLKSSTVCPKIVFDGRVMGLRKVPPLTNILRPRVRGSYE